MTETTNPAVPAPRSGGRRVLTIGGNVPGEWKNLVAITADFEPEDDAHLLAWMACEVNGMSAYAEALTEVYETGVACDRPGSGQPGRAARHRRRRRRGRAGDGLRPAEVRQPLRRGPRVRGRRGPAAA